MHLVLCVSVLASVETQVLVFTHVDTIIEVPQQDHLSWRVLSDELVQDASDSLVADCSVSVL